MVLIDKDVNGPRSIVLDVDKSLIFWSSCDHLIPLMCRIERAGQDGNNRTVLVTQNISNPTALTINPVIQTLFWFEPEMHSLFSINYDGQNRKQLLSSDQISSPLAADVFEDFIFYSNFDLNSIIRIDLNHASAINPIIHALSVKGVKVIHSSKQPNLINRCFNSTCSHLCLPSLTIDNHPSYRCLCRNGYELSKNKFSCHAKHAIRKAIFTFYQDISSSHLTTFKPNLSLNDMSTYNHQENSNSGHNSSHGLTYALVSDAHLAFIIIAVFLTIGLIIMALFLILYRHYKR